MEWRFKVTEISQVAKEFIARHPLPAIFAFHGEMGAGKTTFITALCQQIGKGDTPGSPTFSIINEYLLYNNPDDNKTGTKVYHIDLYRLKDTEEAIRAGVEDVLFSGSTCFAEWPDKAPELFPPGTVHVSISTLDDHTRLLKSPDI